MHTLLHLAVLTGTVLLVERLFSSVKVKSIGTAIVVAIVFSLLNFFLGWLVKVALFVPAILTLGVLFLFVPVHREHGDVVADRQAHPIVRDSDAGGPARLVGGDHGGQLHLSRRDARPDPGGHRAGANPLDLSPNACNLSRMQIANRWTILSVSVLVLAAAASPACKRKSKSGGAQGGDATPVVAKVDDSRITVATFRSASTSSRRSCGRATRRRRRRRSSSTA